jgi:hypothetical protein
MSFRIFLGEIMDSFELNKIAGAVLFTLLVYLGVQNLGAVMFDPEPADPQAYVVEGVVEEGAGSGCGSGRRGRAHRRYAGHSLD